MHDKSSPEDGPKEKLETLRGATHCAASQVATLRAERLATTVEDKLGYGVRYMRATDELGRRSLRRLASRYPQLGSLMGPGEHIRDTPATLRCKTT